MELEKAAFGMGCFWGPDALFGALEGVKRTRVGYAGGKKDDPTYEELGDHTETVMVEYAPDEVGYGELLDVFWENHDHTRRRKPQYRSKIFYTTEEQQELARSSMEEHPEAETYLEELEEFHVAEDYHQKYQLRNSSLVSEIDELQGMDDSELQDSELAMRANAVAAGELEREKLEDYL